MKFPEEDMVFIRDGSDTAKFAWAWSSCSHERARVEALPLAHARGYSKDEEEGGELSSKWFDRMPRGLPPGCLLFALGGKPEGVRSLGPVAQSVLCRVIIESLVRSWGEE